MQIRFHTSTYRQLEDVERHRIHQYVAGDGEPDRRRRRIDQSSVRTMKAECDRFDLATDDSLESDDEEVEEAAKRSSDVVLGLCIDSGASSTKFSTMSILGTMISQRRNVILCLENVRDIARQLTKSSGAQPVLIPKSQGPDTSSGQNDDNDSELPRTLFFTVIERDVICNNVIYPREYV